MLEVKNPIPSLQNVKFSSYSHLLLIFYSYNDIINIVILLNLLNHNCKDGECNETACCYP